MERPNVVNEYRRLVLERNQAEAKIKKLKPEITKILEETGGFPDLYFQTRVITSWDEDKLYDWIGVHYPQLKDKISKKVVDLDKFGEYVKLGTIDVKSIPLNFMIEEERVAICTKERKDENEG